MNTEAKQPEAPDDSPDESGGRRLPLFFSGIAFLVGYILAAGPAVFIVRRIELPLLTTIVEYLFAPIVLIVKLNVPLLSPLIQAWVRLFR